jgi:large subunit ribosomal protein L46
VLSFIICWKQSYSDIEKTLSFTPSSRITEAGQQSSSYREIIIIILLDITKDMRSLDRRLTDSLFLVVKRNRSDFSWQFPQGKWMEGETLRKVFISCGLCGCIYLIGWYMGHSMIQTCERIVDRTTGSVERYFLSNAPIGYYCYAYPPALQQQRKQYGAKVFFYRTQYLTGNLKLETRLYKDHAWIARYEYTIYLKFICSYVLCF